MSTIGNGSHSIAWCLWQTARVEDPIITREQHLPGFTWALFFFPGRWCTISTIHDGRGALVAHHLDICRPAEDRDGVLSFLDLKLDLLMTSAKRS